jgi:hypothetical protein
MSNLLVVKDKVMRFAKELFAQVELGDDGGLVIPWNSTRVFVNTFEREVDPENEDFWNENQLSRTAINVWAPTIFDVKPSNELYKWVATEGADYFYGHCKVMDYGDKGNVQILFEVTIPGDTLDPGELKQALVAVAISADGLDDELKAKFGGMRVEDNV